MIINIDLSAHVALLQLHYKIFRDSINDAVEEDFLCMQLCFMLCFFFVRSENMFFNITLIFFACYKEQINSYLQF